MFWLFIRLFVRDFQHVDRPYVQLSYIRLASWMGILVSLLLGIIKVVFGSVYGSMALISDGIDSFSNVISSIFVIISYRISSAPASLEQPFGAGRAIYIANFTLALFLGFTGFEIISLSIGHLIESPPPLNWGHGIFWIILFSLLANEWQSRLCFFIAKKINSSVLKTEGIHRRADNFFSLAVLIAWIGSFYHIYWLDGAVGIFFGIIILRGAYKIAKNNARELLGTPAPPSLIAEILRLGQTVPGVISIHEIVVHQYGSKNIVSMHVEMDENLHLKESHFICDSLEDLLQDKLHIYAITHADPSNIQNPSTSLLIQKKREFLKDPYVHSLVGDIGHIYVVEDRDNPNILFISLDLFVKRSLDSTEEKNLHDLLYPKIKNLIGENFHLKLRPRPLFGTNTH